MQNYRLISNLPFVSKITEKAAFQKFNKFLKTTNRFDHFHWGFRAHPSSSTALVKVFIDIHPHKYILSEIQSKYSSFVVIYVLQMSDPLAWFAGKWFTGGQPEKQILVNTQSVYGAVGKLKMQRYHLLSDRYDTDTWI